MSSSSDRADFLVKALTDFILPIVHAQVPGVVDAKKRANDIDHSRPQLGPEAQQLVDALKTFIASLIRPKLVHQKRTETKKIEDIRDVQGTIRFVAQPTSKVDENLAAALSSKAKVLRLALEDARDQVFNRMPIRLLTFERDGSQIRLLDRNAIWGQISSIIEAHFNKHAFQNDITHGEYEVNAVRSLVDVYVKKTMKQYASYAILSHTWLQKKPGEVTYVDWKNGKYDTSSPGYQKLVNFCKVAATDHGVTLAWMDTVCIDKDSSAELDESIRSMYKWYLNSSVCITYLGQTTSVQYMRDDVWFTRGWTLQELLAPSSCKFYGESWQRIVPGLGNDKKNALIRKEILAATTITPQELDSVEPWFKASISRKMQWAANRQVTREEDTAYSLMGIFDVSISIAYGEGSDRAFFRLVKEILGSSHDEVQDLLNWGTGPTPNTHRKSLIHISSLFPTSPKQYLWKTKTEIQWYRPEIPITLTHLGMNLPVLLMPAMPALQDVSFDPIGSYYATVDIGDRVSHSVNPALAALPGYRYNLLEKDANTGVNLWSPVTFGVLNFSETECSVNLQRDWNCFAVVLLYAEPTLPGSIRFLKPKIVRTSTSIAFKLQTNHSKSDPVIPKNELANHGMELRTMYL